jgi:hypothetical protein
MMSELDTHYFAIGNIAPDSGIPDEKWEKFDPPIKVTHFRVSGNACWPSADLEFYHRYLASSNSIDDKEHFSFLLGYFFHLVTDNLWFHQIARPTKARFAAAFAADPQFIWEVKRDWYGLDFIFIREHPDSIFWRIFLDCQYTHDYLDFLPQKAIQQNLDYIKAFYQRTDEEIEEQYGKRPDIYLSSTEMDSFIEETTQRLYETYQRVWEGKTNTSGFASVLEFLLDEGVIQSNEKAA